MIEQRNKKLTYGYPGATLYIFRLLYMAAGELIHVYTPLHGVHCVRFHFTAVSGKFGSSNCTGLGFSVILFTSKHGRHFLTRLFGAHGAGQTGFRIISNRNHKIDFTLTHTKKQHNKSFKHRSTRRNSSSTILQRAFDVSINIFVYVTPNLKNAFYTQAQISYKNKNTIVVGTQRINNT